MMKVLAVVILAAVAAFFLWFKQPSIQAVSSDIQFRYIVKYSGGGEKDATLPMLVALHGNGDTAKGFYADALDQFNMPLRIIVVNAPIPYRGGYAWPWDAPELAQYGLALKEVIEALSQQFPTLGKPALLGYSGGGAMAFYQGLQYGDTYSYIFPVSGRLKASMIETLKPRRGARVHAYHGNKDKVVSIVGSRRALELLREARVKVALKEFDGGHHGIFREQKRMITGEVETLLKRLSRSR